MNDRLFVVAVIILTIAVGAAIWQFRSLVWGDVMIGHFTSGTLVR